jgi:hypothetical protein
MRASSRRYPLVLPESPRRPAARAIARTSRPLRVLGLVAGAILLLGVCGLRGESRAAQGGPESEPARLSLRVRDAAGAPIAAHVRIAPRDLGERVRLGRLGDEQRALPEAGAQLSLAPGEYRAVITRGPEWSIAMLELSARPGAYASREVALRREVALPGWLGADLHVHTEHSPDAKHGGVSALELAAEGVELAVVTDHNRIGDLGGGLESIAGAEITTWQPEFGHFNAFPLQRVPAWRHSTPELLLAELARDPSVFVQVNHPRLEPHIAYFELGGFDGERFSEPDFHLDVDGLEVWNGYDIARPERVQALLREWRGWLARGHRLTATGGSDSHGADGHRPGYPRTYVRARGRADLVSALKAGRAFVSNGPLLELAVRASSTQPVAAGPGDQLALALPSTQPVAAGPGDQLALALPSSQLMAAGPGDELALAPGAILEISLAVYAPSWLQVDTLELCSEHGRLWSVQLPAAGPDSAARFRARFELPAGSTRLLYLAAHGGKGLELLLGRGDVEPLAFSNPVYLTRAAPPASGAMRAAATTADPSRRSDPTPALARP